MVNKTSKYLVSLFRKSKPTCLRVNTARSCMFVHFQGIVNPRLKKELSKAVSSIILLPVMLYGALAFLYAPIQPWARVKRW